MVDNTPTAEIKAVLGLGNPGRQYADNRHNLGYMIVDRLVFLKKEEFIKGDGPFLFCRIPLKSGDLILCKSTTYMNNTGRAADKICRYFGLSGQNLLVVSDDCNLPLGKIRYRASGSDGGHNGLASIIDWLQTPKFPRLRVGIGANPSNKPLEEYVLEDFTRNEFEIVDKVIPVVVNFIIKLAAENLLSNSATITVAEE